MYIIFFLTMFAALSEGIGILMILPLLNNFSQMENSQSSLESGSNIPQTSGAANYMESIVNYFGISDSIFSILFLITIAFLIKGLLTFGALGFGAYLNGQLLREFKYKLFINYTNMKYSYYSKKDTGYFINIINEQATASLQSFRSFTNLAGSFINTLVYLSLAFFVAWGFGVMALVAGIVILFLFKWLSSFVRRLSRMKATENGVLAKLLIQSLQAFKYLTATNQIKKIKKIITRSIDKLADYQIKTDIAKAFTTASREPIAVVLIMIILILQLVYLKQPLEPILVSIILFYRGLNSILSIQGGWQTMLESIGSIELIDNEFNSLALNHERDGNYELQVFKQDIHLDQIHFKYEDQSDYVLKNISLKIPIKTSIAIVGKSGSGKSTLVDILTLMHKPSAGELYIDGIRGIKLKQSSWRNQIGYVSQETAIFNDTIANNICLWVKEGKNFNDLQKRISEASSKANLSSFIESLPNGYETIVGDRGLRLSGGQRQRLFIARELFREPSLLILDEATSSLDSESEKAIQKSIDDLKGQTTVIIIAHRLSTIKNVDRIFVLDDGCIVEQGTFDELKNKKNSHFSKSIELQQL